MLSISGILYWWNHRSLWLVPLTVLPLCMVLTIPCLLQSWRMAHKDGYARERFAVPDTFKEPHLYGSRSEASVTDNDTMDVERQAVEAAAQPQPNLAPDIRSIPASSRPMSLAETTAHWSTFSGAATLQLSDIGHLPGCAQMSSTVPGAHCNCTQIPRALYAAALQHVLATDRQQGPDTTQLPDYTK
jgi:hypothetical protein